ncbi:MAG: porin [Oceanospirillaceae bacterium]
MKKSIIALAVAGAMTAPMIAQADATLYGRVHERVVVQEDKDVAIQNAGARIGVKGNSQMDSGLTSFYQIELSFGNSARSSNDSTLDSTSLTVRQMNAGVKGDFGKVIVGRFTNPMTATYVADIYEQNSGLYEQTPFRIGNAVAYTTPSFNGLSATLGVIAEGEGSDDTYEDVDGYVARIGGTFGAITVQAAYMDADYTTASAADADDLEVASFGLAYNANGIYAGLNIESNDSNDEDVVDFALKYTAGKTAYGFGYAVQEGKGSLEDDRVMVGVYHDLGGSADVYTEIARHGATDASDVDTDFNRFTVGYRVKF